MPEYEATTAVDAPATTLFDYLSDVEHLPDYFERMTSAHPTEDDVVHTTADLGGTTVEGDAWFEVDRDATVLSWGSEGPNDYHGHLIVTENGANTSSVTVTLTTSRTGGSEIQDGLDETVANIKRLVEGGDAERKLAG